MCARTYGCSMPECTAAYTNTGRITSAPEPRDTLLLGVCSAAESPAGCCLPCPFFACLFNRVASTAMSAVVFRRACTYKHQPSVRVNACPSVCRHLYAHARLTACYQPFRWGGESSRRVSAKDTMDRCECWFIGRVNGYQWRKQRTWHWSLGSKMASRHPGVRPRGNAEPSISPNW